MTSHVRVTPRDGKLELRFHPIGQAARWICRLTEQGWMVGRDIRKHVAEFTFVRIEVAHG